MMEAKVEENLEKLKVEDAGNEETEEDVVDPWNVTSSSDKGIDYDKLISKFCCLHLRTSISYNIISYHMVTYQSVETMSIS